VKKWLVIALCAPFVLSACKQGLGDRCEVNDDCGSGTCSQAVPKVCVSKQSNDSPIDASLPIDAPTP
jgi:hypothetical protein